MTERPDTAEFYMQRCLELARQGLGRTHPNPMVGCVVLDTDGRVVGKGYHAQYGAPHAEAMALAEAGERARGGTLYVSLEPCNHTGKTPPCTQAILDAGIRRVIYGMRDPNPRVTGGGARHLLSAGIAVEQGPLETACRKLNEAFVYAARTGRPFTLIKTAMSLDGYIAARNGKSRWITGPEARKWVHGLRAQCDAILTTAETAIQDNSRLTVREAPQLGKPPMRIVLDRQLRLDPAAHPMFAAGETAPVLIATRQALLDSDKSKRLQAHGAEVIGLADTGQGLSLPELFDALGQRRVTQLLVEAGGHLAGSLLREGLVQKLWLLYGGKLFLDPAAKPGFVGNPMWDLADALPVRMTNCRMLGDTCLVEAYLDDPGMDEGTM